MINNTPSHNKSYHHIINPNIDDNWCRYECPKRVYWHLYVAFTPLLVQDRALENSATGSGWGHGAHLTPEGRQGNNEDMGDMVFYWANMANHAGYAGSEDSTLSRRTH